MPSDVLLTPGMEHPCGTGITAREINILPHHGPIVLKPLVPNCNKQKQVVQNIVLVGQVHA
jgi:hypothetical protein